MQAKIGDVFEVKGRKFAFLSMRQTRWLGEDVETGQRYTIKGGTPTGEFYAPAVKHAKDLATEQSKRQRAVKNMQVGQAFIFDNEQYYFIKANRTKFVMCNGKGQTFNLRMTANIIILDEIKPLHMCKVCNSRIVFDNNPNTLCKYCE